MKRTGSSTKKKKSPTGISWLKPQDVTIANLQAGKTAAWVCKQLKAGSLPSSAKDASQPGAWPAAVTAAQKQLCFDAEHWKANCSWAAVGKHAGVWTQPPATPDLVVATDSDALPSWAGPLQPPPPPKRILGSMLAVPCSALEPLCAGLSPLTQRLVEMRDHVIRQGRVATGFVERGADDGGAEDAWFAAQQSWSPISMRFWSLQGRSSKDDISVGGSGLDYGTAAPYDAHSAEYGKLIAGDKYKHESKDAVSHNKWGLQSRFSLIAPNLEDHRMAEPVVGFLPSSASTHNGRFWSYAGAFSPPGCTSHDPRLGDVMALTKGEAIKAAAARAKVNSKNRDPSGNPPQLVI